MRLPFLIALLLTSPVLAADKKPLIIGVEYAYPGGGKVFGQLGVAAVKLYPDSITWGDMQRGPGLPIDFNRMDRFVAEYQAAGFIDLFLVLKCHSRWASQHLLFNPTPLAPFLSEYQQWVRAVVERYDHDGKDDMPGLRRPVRYFEIGSEFSSFEPEPTVDYLATLHAAYKGAHAASDHVVVMHAAFLAPTVFRDKPRPEKYAAEFERVGKRIHNHGLGAMRLVLDQHAAFDAVNFHALTGPEEIEPTIAWLRHEMRQRKIDKPIIISDTTPNPLIAWGPSTRLPPMEFPGFPVRPDAVGIVVPPATEKDRPILADYFNRLIDGDRGVLEWTHAFVAADMVKKIVIAAEQGVAIINASFMEDLALFKAPALQGGAGTAAWAGMADTDINPLTEERTIKSLRPSFFALQQLQKHIKNYAAVERVKNSNAKVRLYRFTRGDQEVFVAWHDTPKLYLPGAKLPSVKYKFEIAGTELIVEKMIDKAGKSKPETTTLPIRDGAAEVTVTVRPVFITVKK